MFDVVHMYVSLSRRSSCACCEGGGDGVGALSTMFRWGVYSTHVMCITPVLRAWTHSLGEYGVLVGWKFYVVHMYVSLSRRSSCACFGEDDGVGAIPQLSSGMRWGASFCGVKSGIWCWCDVLESFRLDQGCAASVDDALYPVASTYGCIRSVWVPCDVVVV